MKRWFWLPLAVLMVCPANAVAQEEEKDSPTWWVVFSEQVPPANVMAFEQISSEFAELIQANAPEGMVYYTMSGAEGFSYAVPMENMAGFEMLNAQWMGMVNQIGMEKWEAMSEKSDALVDHFTTNFYVQRDDLSYMPDALGASMGDLPARHIDRLYPKAGMGDEFVAVMKEWVAMYEEHGMETGWMAYQAVSGDDLPMFVLITPSESASAYYAMSDAVDERLGEAGKELMVKSLALMRDFDHYDTRFRPELSVLPEEM